MAMAYQQRVAANHHHAAFRSRTRLPRPPLLNSHTIPPAPWPSQAAHSSSKAPVCCRAKLEAASAAAASAVQLEPQLAFLANLAAQGVLLPVLAGWSFVAVLSAVASRARQWCDDNPAEPLSMELLGLLPAALESPTRVAVALFVATRVLRNIAAGLNDFIHLFKPQWDDWADAAAHRVVQCLGAVDNTLLRLYVVIAVLLGARVLIKWKSLALEYILHHRAGVAHPASLSRVGSHRRKGRSSSANSAAGNSSSSSFSMPQVSKAPVVSVDAAAATDDDDDFDEAAVMQREGSMLSVSMRPRSSAADALPADAVAGSSAAGAAAAAAAAVGGWASSSASDSGGGMGDVAWPAADAGRETDAVERLLLPLDSILSWAIAVMSGLFAVQTLGINIQPLLAIGGASSLIIGLASQALLTNAVMGVSIFLSRPFVPGDSITVQAPGAILVSGVVEKVTPSRTLLRTDDDVLVTLPNKTIAEMIVYNKSRREARSRLVARSWERPFLKFKVKLPQKELEHLQELQVELHGVFRRPGVAQPSVEVALSKFTDAGAEVLVQCLLLVAVGSPTAQQLLLDLAVAVRKWGATLVSIL